MSYGVSSVINLAKNWSYIYATYSNCVLLTWHYCGFYVLVDKNRWDGIKTTKTTPYLALTDDLWDVHCDYFDENLSCHWLATIVGFTSCPCDSSAGLLIASLAR